MANIRPLLPATWPGFGVRFAVSCMHRLDASRRHIRELHQTWERLPRTERALRLNRALAFAVSIALVAALLIMSLRLVRSVTGTHDMRWVPPAMLREDRHTPDTADIETIQAAHLFGTASPPVTEQPANVIDAPPTTAALSLRGIVASTDERLSHAIIADDSAHDHVYFLKSEVAGGIRIAAILADRVILDHSGRHETLWLPRFGASQDTEHVEEASFAEPAEAAGTQAKAVQLIAPPPARLADIMMPRPFLKGSQFAGVQVYPGERGEMFSSLGLKAGDVIVKIDGRTLSATDAAAPFQGLAADASMMLTIDRGGKAVTLKIVNGAPVPVAGNRPVT